LPAQGAGTKRLAVAFLFYLALVFMSYLPMLPGSFLMDDHRLVKDDNGLVTGEYGLFSVWFSGDFSLSTVGWWIQWHLWGEHPAGYHVVNFLLQATSAVLLWRLLEKLKISGAWLAAALFAVHPVCVNSVARMAELKNTLSLPFFLLSFLAYLHYEQLTLNPAAEVPDKSRGRATLWYGISLLAFVLALLSKTTTIMLPVLLLGCAAWQRGRIARTDWLHTAPHFLLALAFGLMSMWYQKHQALAGQTLPPINFAERLAIAGWNFWFYLGKAIVPLHLSIVYFRWKPDVASLLAWLPDLLVVAVFILCWVCRRGWGRHALFALGCFLVALIPALGLVDAQFLVKFQVSDHLEYLPLIAPLVLVAAWLASVAGRKVFALAAGVLILILSGYTMQRAQVFSTQENLMRDTLEKNPLASAAHNDLGVILAQRKDYTNAEAHFEASLKSNPGNDEAGLNLSQLLILQGRFDEAREHLELALAHNPASSDFHEKLATALAQLGRPQEAIIQLKLALRLAQTPHTNTRLALAGLLYGTGDYREAANQYREILSVKPDEIEALNNLAWMLATCPDESVRSGSKAVEYAEYACLITKFKDPHPIGTLAAAYAEAGRFSEAAVTADFAISLAEATQDMQLATINRQLLAYYRAGRAWHEPPAGGNH
jgi:tetratricopeptide (TPR) repeat protein